MKIRLQYPASPENAGDHAATTWHASQTLLVTRWAGPFPGARVPSWHCTQLFATPL